MHSLYRERGRRELGGGWTRMSAQRNTVETTWPVGVGDSPGEDSGSEAQVRKEAGNRPAAASCPFPVPFWLVFAVFLFHLSLPSFLESCSYTWVLSCFETWNLVRRFCSGVHGLVDSVQAGTCWCPLPRDSIQEQSVVSLLFLLSLPLSLLLLSLLPLLLSPFLPSFLPRASPMLDSYLTTELHS